MCAKIMNNIPDEHTRSERLIKIEGFFENLENNLPKMKYQTVEQEQPPLDLVWPFTPKHLFFRHSLEKFLIHIYFAIISHFLEHD